MHKIMVPLFALVGMLLVGPTTANATTRDEAAKACSANPSCKKILSNDDGDIYCVRQADGHCTVVICPEILDCYLFRTSRLGIGNITISTATARRMFRKKPTHEMKIGVQRVMTPQNGFRSRF